MGIPPELISLVMNAILVIANKSVLAVKFFNSRCLTSCKNNVAYRLVFHVFYIGNHTKVSL